MEIFYSALDKLTLGTKSQILKHDFKGTVPRSFGARIIRLHKDHLCHHVNIFEVKQLADDVVILNLIVTSFYAEVSSPCAQPNRVDTPNSPNFGL